MTGRYSHIQRFSTKDGPGIRTTVFLKGCNLRCKWCHNPETIPYRKLLYYIESSCIHCGACARICPTGAAAMSAGLRTFHHELCDSCGKCIDACMQDALGMSGTDISDENLFHLLMRDFDYYQDSHGGITFSGGEPLLQADFLRATAERINKEGVSVAVDTAFNIEWPVIESVLHEIDLVLVDIKSMNRENHYKYTGVYPDLILENIEKLQKTSMKVIVRMPLIAGINDSDEEMQAAVNFLDGWENLIEVEFLPYHSLGVDKAKNYQGAIKNQKAFKAPPLEKIEKIANKFRSSSIPVVEINQEVQNDS